MNYDDILNKLYKLSIKASKKDEVPVSALIVYKNKIIAKAFNKKKIKNDITAHAEILCIKKAAKKLKSWNLSECDLYVSLKPCSMCFEIINQSRIKNVYYLLEKPDYKHEFNKTNYKKMNNKEYSTSYQHLLSTFFKNKRSKNK